MRTFIKVFIVSILFFIVAIYLGAFSYVKGNNVKLENNVGFGFYDSTDIKKVVLSKLESKPKEEEIYSSLEEAMKKSSRVNFLILGMEDVRTDTILLASFNKNTKKMNVLSIPRDTYVHRKNYNSGDARKINSVFYSHGIEGVKKTVSYVLEDIPIHHYVMVDYMAVEEIVNLVDGVEVEVPFHMKYKDPYANPPLNIDIKEGKQILDGKTALEFIRWRKNNRNKGYIDGDLGRIKSQQQLLKSLAGKVNENLLSVIMKAFKFIETDMGVLDGISYGRTAIGIKENDIAITTIPGKADMRTINKKVYSYFIHNSKEVRKVLEEMYNVKK